MFARQNIEVSRQVMASWMGVVGFELTTLHAYMMGQLLKGERLFANETVLPTLSPGNGRVLHNYLWASRRDVRCDRAPRLRRTGPASFCYLGF